MMTSDLERQMASPMGQPSTSEADLLRCRLFRHRSKTHD